MTVKELQQLLSLFGEDLEVEISGSERYCNLTIKAPATKATIAVISDGNTIEFYDTQYLLNKLGGYKLLDSEWPKE